MRHRASPSLYVPLRLRYTPLARGAGCEQPRQRADSHASHVGLARVCLSRAFNFMPCLSLTNKGRSTGVNLEMTKYRHVVWSTAFGGGRHGGRAMMNTTISRRVLFLAPFL